MPVALVPAAYLPRPASCISCGDTSRDCLDFGANIERVGAVLLCTSCVSYAVLQFGSALNAAPLDQHLQVQAALEDANDRLAKVPSALEALRAAVGAAGEQFDRELRDPVSVVREPEEPVDPGPDPEPVGKPARKRRRAADIALGTPVEPVGEPGPDDVPSDPGDAGIRDFDFSF